MKLGFPRTAATASTSSSTMTMSAVSFITGKITTRQHLIECHSGDLPRTNEKADIVKVNEDIKAVAAVHGMVISLSCALSALPSCHRYKISSCLSCKKARENSIDSSACMCTSR